jgi:predicted nucleotide-binding protein (sugar kinase/HSP70/actin superfamily)
LVVANLQRAGIDARLLEETPLSIQKGMRLNTGQCIPISVITQEMVDYVRGHQLDPARVVLWMGQSNWSCGIHLYPYYIKSLLEAHGMGQAGVYVGEISHFELSPKLVIDTYFAYLFGGLLRRIGCRIRPYELHPGETDRLIAEARELFVAAFRGERSRLATLREVIRRFEAIPTALEGEVRLRGRFGGRESLGHGGDLGGRPKVAIFGDLYVRDNDVMNQDLVHWIEAAGGEVVTTPYSEYVRIIAEAYFHQWRKQGMILPLIKNKALLAAVQLAERRFFSFYKPYVSPPESFRHPEVEKELGLFNVRLELSGESYDNVLKILHLLRLHPDISLFVQTNPAFCCPSLVTEGMTRKIEELTGVPVVTLTYDGTGAPRNDLIMPYLRYPRRRGSKSVGASSAPAETRSPWRIPAARRRW